MRCLRLTIPPILVQSARVATTVTKPCQWHAGLRVMLALLFLTPVRMAMAANDDTLQHAWELNRLGEYDHALRIFKDIEKDSAAKPADKLMALYGEANIWNYRSDGNDPEKARALYAEIIKQAPAGDPLASWSDFESVQSMHYEKPAESRDYPAIAQAYLDVSQRQSGTPAGDEAYLTYINLEASLLKATPEDIIQKCEAFIQAHPNSPWLSNFYDQMAGAYDTLKQPRQEIECKIKSAEAAVKTTPAAAVDNSTNYWQIAYLAEFELGDFPLARQYYQKLIDEYPSDQRVFPAKQALARMNVVETAAREGRTVPLNPETWHKPWIQP